MTELPAVPDLSAYLQATGWILQAETWHGASVWLHGSGREVLVPPTDTAPDTERRLRETLQALSSVELRATGEIVREIVQPYADMQTYWTFPDGSSLDLDTLAGRYDALHSIRRILLAIAESLATEASSESATQAAIRYSRREINALMQRVELVPVEDPGRLAIRVPIGDRTEEGTGLGANLLPRLAEAIGALHHRDLAPRPDDPLPLLEAGVSASLCRALSALTGHRRDRPLRVDFRWARGRPSNWENRTLWFDAGWGERVQALAGRLGNGPEATAAVVGRVQSLHGQEGNDRWVVKVTGELDGWADDRRRRNLRVLLPDGEAYDQALAAHRNDWPVRATGRLVTRGRQRELLVETGGFEVVG